MLTRVDYLADRGSPEEREELERSADAWNPVIGQPCPWCHIGILVPGHNLDAACPRCHPDKVRSA